MKLIYKHTSILIEKLMKKSLLAPLADIQHFNIFA